MVSVLIKKLLWWDVGATLLCGHRDVFEFSGKVGSTFLRVLFSLSLKEPQLSRRTSLSLCSRQSSGIASLGLSLTVLHWYVLTVASGHSTLHPPLTDILLVKSEDGMLFYFRNNMANGNGPDHLCIFGWIVQVHPIHTRDSPLCWLALSIVLLKLLSTEISLWRKASKEGELWK